MSLAVPVRLSRSQRERQRRRRRIYGVLTRLYRALFPSSAGARLRADVVRRLLLVRDDRIGDLIVTTPLIDFLRSVAPHAEVDVVCSRANAAVLLGDARVSHVFVNDGTWIGRVRLVLALRRRAYDATFSVIPGNGVREGWFACLVARRHTARVSIWRPKRYHGFFTRVARSPWSLTLMPDQVLHVGVSSFAGPARSIATGDWPMRMHIPAESAEVVSQFLARADIPDFVAVNLWAAEAWRVWPPNRCAEVLQRLTARNASLHVVLTPPPGRAPDAAAVRSAVDSPRIHVFPADARLADRAALIARSRLAITCNTAVVPMASAFGRPVVGLYSSRPADRNERYLPRDVPQRIVYAPPGGAVCDIRPDDVIAAYDALVAELERSKRG